MQNPSSIEGYVIKEQRLIATQPLRLTRDGAEESKLVLFHPAYGVDGAAWR